MCWVSLLLWGCCLGAYVVREALRENEMGFHMVGGATVAKFVDVLTVQEPDGPSAHAAGGLLHEPRRSSFRGGRRDGRLTGAPIPVNRARCAAAASLEALGAPR